MIPDRTALLSQVEQTQHVRLLKCLQELERLDEASAIETKSSAGDKYETGREMIAQARIVIESNLAVTKICLDAIERMLVVPLMPKVLFGSLVETSLGWYLVGVSVGELVSNGISVNTLSLASPMGMALKGKERGAIVPWRGSSFIILSIPSLKSS